jgi:hypothetical protein
LPVISLTPAIAPLSSFFIMCDTFSRSRFLNLLFSHFRTLSHFTDFKMAEPIVVDIYTDYV